MQNVNTPTNLVIFGATGDLVAKKVVPALFRLFAKNALPPQFRITGFSRRNLGNAKFRQRVAKIIPKPNKDFSSLFYYEQGVFENLKDYKALAKKLATVDEEWSACSNKLFYLAVPPKYYKNVFTNLAASNLTKPCSPEEGWTRILVEKPFGKDLATSRQLDDLLGKLFKEIQIYRIDHYLAKEMLQNILTFRFSNNLFEQSWNNKRIERIEIRLLERIGVEDRGSFYDDIGALRDVGQNHLLQMLALTTMEQPPDFSADAIRKKRAEILTTLQIPTQAEVSAASFRAQYAGFRKIDGVKPDSQTETYFKLRAFLTAERWRGVPIFLESGKRLANPRKEIVLIFRHPSPCLCPPGRHYQNKVVIRLEPREAIQIDFWGKKPGLTMDIEKKSLDFFLRQKKQQTQYTEEYEKLLLDCIAGDQTLFISTREVKAMWKFIDPFVRSWHKNLVPLNFYRPDNKDILAVAEKEIGGPAAPKINKEIGIIGLGKMGTNIAKRLLDKDWRVVGYNRSRAATDELVKSGLDGAYSLAELSSQLTSPKLLWLMVPAGKAVDEVIGKLLPTLKRGDVIVDGGNSFYQDSVRREKLLKKRGIRSLDVGVSGGPAGARNGASLMVGGDKKLFAQLAPLFADLAVENGYEYMGSAGAGHFVKMVHNGIEYGMMQAIAEGFTLLKRAKYKLNLAKVASVYNHGSVVESRLIGWLKEAFQIYGESLDTVSGSAGHTGEGAWTVQVAKREKIKVRVIEEAMKFRIASAKNPSYTGRILSALRNRFGGHTP